GTNGGIWRSEDTGKTWQLMLAGQASDVLLNPDSGIPLNTDVNPGATGNLQIVYAGMEQQGIFMSPNQGPVWNLMNPFRTPMIIQPLTNKHRKPVPKPNPHSGTDGPIVLAMPSRTGNAVQDAIYGGWLYAAVSDIAGNFVGLFMTKDYGQNWVSVSLATL